jgi:hypothetical protein
MTYDRLSIRISSQKEAYSDEARPCIILSFVYNSL